jgi:hypothetical protein
VTESQADAPDGATQAPGGDQPREDLVPRAEALKAFEQRDKLKAKVRELEAKLAEKPAPPSKPAEVPDFTGVLGALTEKIEQLTTRLEGKEQGERRAKIVESILARVPDGNRPLASVVLDGLVARGQLSLDGKDPGAIVDAAAKTLQTSHAEIFRLPGSSNSALQVGPDGKIDWDSVRTAADVPADQWANIPDRVMDRLTGAIGAKDGADILLGR